MNRIWLASDNLTRIFCRLLRIAIATTNSSKLSHLRNRAGHTYHTHTDIVEELTNGNCVSRDVGIFTKTMTFRSCLSTFWSKYRVAHRPSHTYSINMTVFHTFKRSAITSKCGRVWCVCVCVGILLRHWIGCHVWLSRKSNVYDVVYVWTDVDVRCTHTNLFEWHKHTQLMGAMGAMCA